MIPWPVQHVDWGCDPGGFRRGSSVAVAARCAVAQRELRIVDPDGRKAIVRGRQSGLEVLGDGRSASKTKSS